MRQVPVDALGSTAAPELTEDALRPNPIPETGEGSRAARKRGAREAATPADTEELQKERHLRRQEERRQAKHRRAETPGAKRFINTDRFGGVRAFYNDAASEIRKVEWPDREATRNLTVVVIALSLVLGLLLGGIDYTLFQLFEAMS